MPKKQTLEKALLYKEHEVTYLNTVPILASEGILGLLLKTLLSLRKSLVLANSHGVLFQSFTRAQSAQAQSVHH